LTQEAIRGASAKNAILNTKVNLPKEKETFSFHAKCCTFKRIPSVNRKNACRLESSPTPSSAAEPS